MVLAPASPAELSSVPIAELVGGGSGGPVGADDDGGRISSVGGEGRCAGGSTERAGGADGHAPPSPSASAAEAAPSPWRGSFALSDLERQLLVEQLRAEERRRAAPGDGHGDGDGDGGDDGGGAASPASSSPETEPMPTIVGQALIVSSVEWIFHEDWLRVDEVLIQEAHDMSRLMETQLEEMGIESPFRPVDDIIPSFRGLHRQLWHRTSKQGVSLRSVGAPKQTRRDSLEGACSLAKHMYCSETPPYSAGGMPGDPPARRSPYLRPTILCLSISLDEDLRCAVESVGRLLLRDTAAAHRRHTAGDGVAEGPAEVRPAPKKGGRSIARTFLGWRKKSHISQQLLGDNEAEGLSTSSSSDILSGEGEEMDEGSGSDETPVTMCDASSVTNVTCVSTESSLPENDMSEDLSDPSLGKSQEQERGANTSWRKLLNFRARSVSKGKR